MNVNSIAVFCGSNYGNDHEYKEDILLLGREMKERNISLVYGGGHRGLMGEISSCIKQLGCKTIGISPRRFYKDGDEKLSDEFYLVDTMHERKALMYDKADAFIIFPGGIGTLDEGVEISTWYQIGFSGKPVVIYNIKGFFDGFKMQLERMLKDGFIRQDFMDFLYFSDNIDNIFSHFDSFLYVKGKWEK